MKQGREGLLCRRIAIGKSVLISLPTRRKRTRALAVPNDFPAQRERARDEVSSKRGSKAMGFSVVVAMATTIGIGYFDLTSIDIILEIKSRQRDRRCAEDFFSHSHCGDPFQLLFVRAKRIF